MNKNILKIVLITFSVVSLGLALYFFTEGIATCPSEVVTVPSFDTYVQSQVNQKLEGSSYEEAHVVFDSLLIDITTESAIMRGDGSKIIEDSEFDRSKLILFCKYVPIFNAYCNRQFQANRWNRDNITRIRSEARFLLGLNVTDREASALKNSLNTTVGVVDDYFAAWAVANSASRCTTVSSIEVAKRNADKYKKSPLTNDHQLSVALDAVEQTAKEAVVRVIVYQCQTVAQGYNNHADYNAWNQEYNGACRRIKEYTDKYGANPSLTSAKRQLDDADRAALEHFTKQQNNNP